LGKAKVLLATKNRAKVKEYSKLLRGIPYEIVSLEDVGIAQDVEESGKTFEENAAIKAKKLVKKRILSRMIGPGYSIRYG